MRTWADVLLRSVAVLTLDQDVLSSLLFLPVFLSASPRMDFVQPLMALGCFP